MRNTKQPSWPQLSNLLRTVQKLRIIALICYLCFGAMFTEAAKSPWGVWAGYKDVHAKGKMANIVWSEWEPKPGIFNTTRSIKKFTKQADPTGYAIVLMKHAGNKTPNWVYDDYGVPRLFMPNGTVYPYYMYQNKQGEYVYLTLLAEYLKSIVRELRNELNGKKLLSIMFIYGPDGDPGAFQEGELPVNLYDHYNGDSKQDWNKDWSAFKEVMSARLLAALDEVNAEFPEDEAVLPLLNREMLPWALGQSRTFMFKASGVTQYFHGRFDGYLPALYQAIHQPSSAGKYYRTRAEMENKKNNYFQSAELWCMNYQCLWNLTFGLDTWQLWKYRNRDRELVALSSYKPFWPIFDFFNQYASYRKAQDSPGAWIAFRDGIDYSDVLRFPEARYGLVDRDNTARVQKILNDYANPPGGFGAKILDWRAIGSPRRNGFGSEHAQNVGVNDRPDVAWQVWRDNYAMFVSQVDANETTYSHFRVGDPDVDQWGRYARGISGAVEERSKIYLDVDDTFMNRNPQNLHVKIVYYDAADQAGQSWFLTYESANGATSQELVKRGGDTWRIIEWELEEAILGNELARNADFIISSSSDPDAHSIFAFFEITRTVPLSTYN